MPYPSVSWQPVLNVAHPSLGGAASVSSFSAPNLIHHQPFLSPHGFTRYGTPTYSLHHTPYHPSVKAAVEHLPHPEHHHPSDRATEIAKHLAIGVGLFVGALILKRAHLTKPLKQFLIPADWKSYAQIFMAVGAINQVDKAFKWQPPPWLGAIQSLLVINPILLGFKRAALIQTLALAPFVIASVTATAWLNKHIAPKLEEKYGIPSPVTKLGISVAMIAASMGVTIPSYKFLAGKGLFGAELKEKVSSSILGATCACGSCGSVICITEIADIGGATLKWATSHSPFASGNTTHSKRSVENRYAS